LLWTLWLPLAPEVVSRNYLLFCQKHRCDSGLGRQLSVTDLLGTIAVDHHYTSVGTFTVTVCIGSYSLGMSCDELLLSITDYFVLHLRYIDQQRYVQGFLQWTIRTTGVNPRVKAELRHKPASVDQARSV
jgi:hypothetical protein